MLKATYLALTLVVMGLLIFGCSDNGADTATMPDITDTTAISINHDSQRMLWGVWDIQFDPANQTANINPIRNCYAHYNITDMIIPPACDDCLGIEVLWFDPVSRILGVEVTLRNPTTISAYDLRGILYTNDYGHLLTDADDWTGLWDIPGGEMLNPFKAFAKGEPNRLFAGEAEHSEYYKIYIPQPPNYSGITFAVDASWPVNCKEPYEITNFWQEPIYDKTGAFGNIYVDVRDWQFDINKVTLVAPEITGEDFTQFSHLVGDVWSLTLTNYMGASKGVYDVRIIATSDNSGTLPLYDYIVITISTESQGWARTWGGDESEQCRGVAVDDVGNIYATGYFYSTVDFDPGTGTDIHMSEGEEDIFLCKYNADGEFLWAVTWGGEEWDHDADIASDINGNIFVTGRFQDSVDFDPSSGNTTYTSNGSSDVFLSKFGPEGDFLWVRVWGSAISDMVYDVAVDTDGNAYVAGGFGGTADFDPGPATDVHTPNGNGDAFLSKFDNDGGFLWVQTWGGLEYEVNAAVTTDSIGNVYVAGDYYSLVDFDPGPNIEEHLSNGDEDIYLSKFSGNGDFQWVRTWGGQGQDLVNELCTDSSDSIYATGSFIALVDFNAGSATDEHHSSGAEDIFLSKFDSTGGFLWVCTWGGSGRDLGLGVCAKDSSGIFVSGSYCDVVDFDASPAIDKHISNGYDDIFLCLVDVDGTYKWVQTWGGVGQWEYGMGVTTDIFGNPIVVGKFRSTVDFDPGVGVDEHTSQGVSDAFLGIFP